jgi:predicted ATP-dependent endonuclease of OLD family
MYSVLKLIVEYESGIKIPATHNGLGYNNLIYMSLLLAKMQVNADVDYLDINAKVFTTLAIEEPEAHLHPAMQYKFLKFLNENKKEKKVRQIFVTTHSTHITGAVSLDEIICLHNEEGKTSIGYQKNVFPNDKSKKYVQRFLDATKSDMLFSQKVLFVEGIAEQLLMSIFANYIDKSLEDNHVSIISVGGRCFDHFLYLFDVEKENTTYKNKFVAWVSDDLNFIGCIKNNRSISAKHSEAAVLELYEMEPAKGGGYVGLDIKSKSGESKAIVASARYSQKSLKWLKEIQPILAKVFSLEETYEYHGKDA